MISWALERKNKNKQQNTRRDMKNKRKPEGLK
jgi:hypothetical protein